MADEVTNLIVTLKKIHVFDDEDTFGSGELYFHGTVGTVPIARSPIFDAATGSDITLTGPAWQKIVDVRGQSQIRLVLHGFDEDLIWDDSLGTVDVAIAKNARGEWPDATFTARSTNPGDFALEYRVEPVLALDPARPETAVVCREHAGSASCSTLSGVPVRVTKIKATVISTPPRTLRAAPPTVANAWNAPIDLNFETTKSLPRGPVNFVAADFNTPDALVLVRNSAQAPQGPIRLEAETDPPGVDVFFQVVRDPAEVGALGAGLPTVTNTGNSTATLATNERGSFYVLAYIDGNRNQQRDDNEPGIKLPLIIVECTVTNNRSAANPALYTARFNNVAGRINAAGYNFVQISAGRFGAGAANAGVSFDADVLLVGGGADGRRGTDRVFLGWSNHIEVMVRQGNYSGGLTVSDIIADNVPGGIGNQGSFLAAAPAPNLIPPFWLDSGRSLGPAASHARLGGENILFVNSRPDSTHAGPADTPQPLGVQRTMTAIDSPGFSESHNHPNNAAHPAGRLRSIREQLNMVTRLMAWTNSAGGGGQPMEGTANAVGFRTFTVIAKVAWVQQGTWNVTFSGGQFHVRGAAAPNAPSLVAVSTLFNPAVTPSADNAEVRNPTALEFYGTDAR